MPPQWHNHRLPLPARTLPLLASWLPNSPLPKSQLPLPIALPIALAKSQPPLTVGNHDYQFWNLSLEECVNMALQNARFLVTTGGTSETRQNIAAQFVSGTADQFGSVYDVALQQTTTRSAGPYD